MEKKNLSLAEYWHKHYEHENLQDYREFGKTIRRAMDAGQRSVVILRISCSKHIVRESSNPVRTPRGSVYHVEDKPKLVEDFNPLIQWVEIQQGLCWKIGMDILIDIMHPLMSNYADFVVYWKPIHPMSAQLKDYWIFKRGTHYEIIKRAMDCGQKYAIIDTLYAPKDYEYDDLTGYKDGTIRSYHDLSPIKGHVTLKMHKEYLCTWTEREQGLRWFYMLGDNWIFFTVYWGECDTNNRN